MQKLHGNGRRGTCARYYGDAISRRRPGPAGDVAQYTGPTACVVRPKGYPVKAILAVHSSFMLADRHARGDQSALRLSVVGGGACPRWRAGVPRLTWVCNSSGAHVDEAFMVNEGNAAAFLKRGRGRPRAEAGQGPCFDRDHHRIPVEWLDSPAPALILFPVNLLGSDLDLWSRILFNTLREKNHEVARVAGVRSAAWTSIWPPITRSSSIPCSWSASPAACWS